MPSDRTPKQQPDPARQAVYIWQRINPRNNGLIRDKLGLAHEQLRKDIEKEGAEIRHANRLNLNKTGVAFMVLEMWGQKVDGYTGKCYEIFCHHWDLLGERKTGAFVRVVLDILLPTIDRLGRSADHAANGVHRRRGLIGASLAGSYKKCARAICDRWRKKLDIEARDLDLAEAHEHLKKARLTETRQPTREVPVVPQVSPAMQPPGKEPESDRRALVLPILDEKGWSINDWAGQSGVDFHTADCYLKGQRNPYPSTRHKLAKSLGIATGKLPL